VHFSAKGQKTLENLVVPQHHTLSSIIGSNSAKILEVKISL